MTVFFKIGAITAPPYTGPPPVSGPKRLIRLRRSAPDTNANGVPDWWELANNFPAFAAFNADTNDADSDGLVTLLEYEYGTNPRKSDTDGDGLTDLEEINASSDPLKFDLPDITLEYAWREAEGADDRVSATNATRTISGKASNGTTERPPPPQPPLSPSS